MALAKRKHEWAMTSELLAMLFNTAFRPNIPLTAADFDPTVERVEEALIEAPITALRVFVQ